MCIMEIRPGQHSSTMQQACTHNLGTVLNDQDMFTQVLTNRGHGEFAERVAALQAEAKVLYNKMCDLYGEMVAEEVEHLTHYTDHHDHEHGNERTEDSLAHLASEIAEADIHRARKYETR